jgi:hypothetical protein
LAAQSTPGKQQKKDCTKDNPLPHSQASGDYQSNDTRPPQFDFTTVGGLQSRIKLEGNWMTRYNIDTLINLISHESEECRLNKAKAERIGYTAGVEYWTKELADIEALSKALQADGIIH